MEFFTKIIFNNLIKKSMKKGFYISILLAILLQSCLPTIPYDKDYIGIAFVVGSAEKSSEISYIKTDDSLTFVLRNGTFPDTVVGERVYAEGDLYNGNGGFDYALNAFCFVVPVKEAQIVPNIDLTNNANVSFDSNRIWQTGKYLNFCLIYAAAESGKHSFDFLIDSETGFKNNSVTINIYHNNGDDIASSYKKIFFSLDLTNLFEKFTDNFEIKFEYIENSQKREVTIPDIKRF